MEEIKNKRLQIKPTICEIKKKNTMYEINDLLDIEEKANKLEDIATEMLQTEIRGERQKKSQDYQ